MEPHFSRVCTVAGWEEMVTSWNAGSPNLIYGKSILLWGWSNTGAGCSQRLWPNLSGQGVEQLALAGSVLKRKLSPWRSLPTYMFLWFWDIISWETDPKYISLYYFIKSLIMENFHETITDNSTKWLLRKGCKRDARDVKILHVPCYTFM